MKSKFICTLLALLLVCLPLLTACGDGETESSAAPVESNASAESGETSASDDPYARFKGPDGRYVWKTPSKSDWSSLGTITFLTCGVNAEEDTNSEIVYNTYSGEASSNLPTQINDDIKERNEILKETIGVEVKEKFIYDGKRYGGDMANYIRTNSLVGTDEYQVVVPCMYDGGSLAVENQFYNLYDLADMGLQIDAPWWNQEFNNTLTMGGQLYMTIGDIGLINKNATACLYFNLDFWNKLGLDKTYGGTPYDLVESGDWTVDLVFESVRSVDPSSSGAVDDPIEGTFGWGGQLDDMWSIFFASGERIAKADEEGYPYLTMFTERSARLMEKLQNFVTDKEHYISGNNYFGYKGQKWPMVLVRAGFTEGRALYYNASVGDVNEMGVMEEHFGIVPVPKADKTQEVYYSLVNPWVSNCFAIPVSNTGEWLQMTVDALNILGAASANTVAKDYDEVVLKWMKTRDDETVRMLFEYILPNRACDVGMIYKWGSLDSLLQKMASEPIGSFSSNYEASEQKAQQALDETANFFRDNAK